MKQKQLKTDLMLLCDYANVSTDGKLNINGIFDEFRSEKFPAGFAEKYLVIAIQGEENESYDLNIKLHKGEIRQNLLNPMSINATTGPNGKHNLIVKLQGIAFDKPGEYYFTVYYNNEEFNSIRLKVIDLKNIQEDQKMNVRAIN